MTTMMVVKIFYDQSIGHNGLDHNGIRSCGIDQTMTALLVNRRVMPAIVVNHKRLASLRLRHSCLAGERLRFMPFSIGKDVNL